MNVICVYSVEDALSSEKPLQTATDIPFGIALIGTVLKKAGNRVKMLVFSPMTPIRKTLHRVIHEFQPRLFCLTAVATQFPLVKRIAETVKGIDSGIFVCIGGSHPSLNPDEVIAHSAVDAVCIGEGEEAIVELASQLGKGMAPSGISNLWIKTRKGTIEKNPRRLFIQDLDRLPYIDREMWKPWINDFENMPSLLIGRGCPNTCAFCSNHKLSHLGKGKYVRFRSPENIIGELKEILKESPGISKIYFEIETLGAKPDFIFRLGDALRAFNSEREAPICFGANFALTDGLVNDRVLLHKILAKLREANFEFLNVGLESGSERIRNEVLRRPRYSNANFIRFCDLAGRYSIQVYMNVMMGLPGESYDDFKETIRVVRRCQPQDISLAIYYPYPGTHPHATAMSMSLISRKTTKNERRSPVLSLEEFSLFQIRREYLLFYFRVYRGHRPLANLLFHTFWQTLSNHPRLSHSLRKLTFTASGKLTGLLKSAKIPA